MEITKISLTNFRKHKKNSIVLNEKKIILVGQNNIGKSTFIEAINHVVNKKKFLIQDFYEERKQFIKFLTKYRENPIIETIDKYAPRLKIEIKIKVSEEDDENYAKVVELLTDYFEDNENNEFVYKCEYSLKSKTRACNDYLLSHALELSQVLESDDKIIECILKDYYEKKEYLGDGESYLEMPAEIKLSDIIELKLLEANLQIDGSTDAKKSKIADSMLSLMNEIINKNNELKKRIDQSLDDTSQEIVSHYERDLSKQLIEVFKTFGFNNDQSGTLKIDLKLTLDNIIQRNFKTLFCITNNEDDSEPYNLPDNYNGLGYNNLLYTLMEIYSFITLVRTNKKPIMLLCIEEPETHMHPEMELKFIERIDEIKDIYISILEEEVQEEVRNKLNNSLQIVITTHSANIVTNSLEKNLVFLNKNKSISYSDINLGEKFAIQYLTTQISNALFSKKIILVEGDVERILIPEFIKLLGHSNDLYSIVQVGGTYFDSFRTLYEKIGASVLIITDLDLMDKESDKNNPEIRNNPDWISSTRSSENEKFNKTSNTIFKKIFGEDTLIMDIAEGKRIQSGNTYVASQRILSSNEEDCTYLVGRTFEEQFILENKEFLHSKKEIMDSINNYKHYDKDLEIEEFSYGLYKYIDRNNKKTAFTFDILLNIYNSSINIPKYIKDGIIWLMEQ